MKPDKLNPHDLHAILNRWLAPIGGDLPELYAVGGAVRDHLMGRPLRDVDLVCRDAAGFARLLADCQDIPATVVPFTRDREAPCFRVVNCRCPEDFVDVVNLRGSGIEEDLTLRDFTVNAMAVRIAVDGCPGELIDYLNGRQDLAGRLIRACGPEALSDDPARVLRAARLAAMLDFAIAPNTVELMRQSAGRLADVAPERICAELLKLLNCPRSLPHVRLLDETGALAVILPEITAEKGCEQNAYHHLDVWEHSIETLARCERIIDDPDMAFGRAGREVQAALDREENTPLLKLAALLHDAGKPWVRKFDPDKGRGTFHGHARRGAEIAAAAAARLRFSSARNNMLTLLVRHHMRPVILSQLDVKQAAVVRWFREVNDAALLIMVLAVADVAAKSGEKLTIEAKDRFFSWAREATINYLESMKEKFSRPNLITGHDLIALGMTPGPALGKMLAAIREKQDLGEITSRDQALAFARGGRP